MGFGPFRWVCTSGDPEDLRLTDQLAAEVTATFGKAANERSKQQFDDNYLWITKAEEHKLVVGSQARILYSNCEVHTTEWAMPCSRILHAMIVLLVITFIDDHSSDCDWQLLFHAFH